MPLPLHTPLPSLEGITEWINCEPVLDEAQNNPILIYFWAMSCLHCHQNMPKVRSFHNQFTPQGLRMIAIHCPRMKTDTDIQKVKNAVKEYGIVEPCGIDNLHKTKQAFDNHIWPSFFLFDDDATLKMRSAGQSGLSMLEPVIKKLLD